MKRDSTKTWQYEEAGASHTQFLKYKMKKALGYKTFITLILRLIA